VDCLLRSLVSTGILLVLFKWPKIGFLLEMFGVANLFGCASISDAFPSAYPSPHVLSTDHTNLVTRTSALSTLSTTPPVGAQKCVHIRTTSSAHVLVKTFNALHAFVHA
jgi:hypothetical protein